MIKQRPIALILAFTLALSLLLTASGCFGKKYTDDDYKVDEYTEVVYKEKGKDFVILNFADVQLEDPDFRIADDGTVSLGLRSRAAFYSMDYLVNEVKPDLITLTGDQIWGGGTNGSGRGIVAITAIIEKIESYKIPWAPVHGNHDHELFDVPEEMLAELYTNADYCLWQNGPAEFSHLGNYAINIVEKGETDNDKGTIVQTLYMLNSNRYLRQTKDTTYYDHVHADQILWYEKQVNAVTELNGGKLVPSLMFFHIPFLEYKTAYAEWKADSFSELVGWGRHAVGGACLENYGLFETIKKLGSTTQTFCGHTHSCNSTVLYHGVYLTYCVKTGPGCENPELTEGAFSGGTRITLKADYSVTTEHVRAPMKAS